MVLYILGEKVEIKEVEKEKIYFFLTQIIKERKTNKLRPFNSPEIGVNK